MSPALISTKLYIPAQRRKVVVRPRLDARLNVGLARNGRFAHKLTLVSAPAGFGKTTLVSEWLASCELPVAWLSLDEGDNDPARFLIYLIGALQTLAPPGVRVSDAEHGVTPNFGQGLMGALQSPQPPPVESILTALLNEIAPRPGHFVLVLDDYHVIDARAVDHAVAFLLEHQPPQMHLVLATRQDPSLPLAQLRARGQLTELRAADLRFTPAEAAKFLNQVMGLNLSTHDISALETRTEGWIAGLQLAALALQGHTTVHGHKDAQNFIQSFTGSHRFVMDYLVEQVLLQQPESVQNFLLCTSILDRMCGPLCDAVLGRDEALSPNTTVHRPPSAVLPSPPSSLMLDSLERHNLFIIPLDNERRWYRYHHLFADLLRQRLHQNPPSDSISPLPLEEGAHEPTRMRQPQSASVHAEGVRGAPGGVAALHIRASQWYEDNGLALEAFHHAAAANDVERAERLMSGKGIPLHFYSGVTPILDWLDSLPRTVLDARPWLWVSFGAMLLITGRTDGVEEKLRAGEAALQAAGLVTDDGLPVSLPQTSVPIAVPEDKIRYMVGQIASARSTLALTRYDVKNMLAQSSRALEYLSPDSVPYHTALWVQGYAYYVIGERNLSRRSFTDGISVSRASGDMFSTILSTIGLGNVQEVDNELHQAAQTYRLVLELAGEHPQQIIHEAHLGLARVLYAWNDLDAAEHHGQQALHLARQYDIQVIDRFILCQIFLARLKLARGDVSGAAALIAQTEESARKPNFAHRLPEVAAVQVLVHLQQGNLAQAAQLANTFPLPLTQSRVLLAQGDASAALALLEPLRLQADAMNLVDERLKIMVLQAVAYHSLNQTAQALHVLGDALKIAESAGCIRLFLDEGTPMAQLLSQAVSLGILTDYVAKLLAPFNRAAPLLRPEPVTNLHSPISTTQSPVLSPQPLPELLTPREIEILRLLAHGLSNREISDKLHLALDTVKGHNRRIFDKLNVQRRTEAVARARELGLL